MKLFKNNLDEMQEQKLLKVEHYGCWFAFWALFAVVMAEFFMGKDFSTMGAEWFVFMALAIFLGFGSIRVGVWDRRLKPNLKTNLITSLIAGGFMTIFTTIMITVKFGENCKDTPWLPLFSGLFTGVFTFILCLIALQISAAMYKKKVKSLENACEDDIEKESKKDDKA